MMTIRTRRYFFYSFVVVFVILGLYLILTVRGLVPDALRFAFVQTGGIFIHSEPTDASIYLNGKHWERRRALLGGGVLIPNLLPGLYTISVSKPGFASWEKVLEVRAGEVTSASNIRLWPQILESTTLLQDNTAFWLTDAGLVTRDMHGMLHAGDQELRGGSVTVSDANSPFIVTTDGSTFFWTDLTGRGGALNINELFNSLHARLLGVSRSSTTIEALTKHPLNPQKLVAQTETALYALDVRRIELERLFDANRITASTVAGNEVLAAAGNVLFSYHAITRATATTTLDVAEPITKLVGTTDGLFVLLETADRTLYLLNRRDRGLALIARQISNFVLSPEEKRVVIISRDGSIELFFLDVVIGDTREQPGTRAPFSVVLDPPLDSIEWLKGFSHYVVALHNGALAFIETDTRPPQHVTTVAENVSQFAIDNNLFVLTSEGELRTIDISR